MPALAAAPITPLSSDPGTLLSGSSLTLRIDLTSEPGWQFNNLLTAVARVEGPYSVATGDSGPLWCELYLQKGALLRLVDKGYIRVSGIAGTINVVGLTGIQPVDPNLAVIATFVNETAGTVIVRLDVETQATSVPLGCRLDKLSTQQEAIWEFKGTILENAAGGGNHTLAILPAAGDELGLLWGAINNGDAAGRNAFVNIQDSVPVNSLSVLSGTGAAVSIAAGVTQNVPNGILPGSLAMAGNFIRSPDTILFELDAVAQTKTTTFWAWCRIRGRVPTSTLASTGAAPTLTKVINRVQ